MLKNQTKHPFDDAFIYRHFIAWLDAYAIDDKDWQNIYSRIYSLLDEEPSLVDRYAWSEMNLMAN